MLTIADHLAAALEEITRLHVEIALRDRTISEYRRSEQAAQYKIGELAREVLSYRYKIPHLSDGAVNQPAVMTEMIRRALLVQEDKELPVTTRFVPEHKL